MCRQYTESGELVSRVNTKEALGKIKRNYDGCKEKGLLNELFHGKWKQSFMKLLDEATGVASVYTYETITQHCLILETEAKKPLMKAYEDIVTAHATEIKDAIIRGDMDTFDTVLSTCHEEFMPFYSEYMVNDTENLLAYAGQLS